MATNITRAFAVSQDGYVGINTYNTDMGTIFNALADVPTSTVLLSGNNDWTGLNTYTQDVEITVSTKGLILKSPGGTRFRITIDNTGALVTESL